MPRFAWTTSADDDDDDDDNDHKDEPWQKATDAVNQHSRSDDDDDDLDYSDDDDDDDENVHWQQFAALHHQASLGTTRFTLDDDSDNEEEEARYRRRWGYTNTNRTTTNDMLVGWTPVTHPPLHHRVDADTAPTQALLRLLCLQNNDNDNHDDDLQRFLARRQREAPPGRRLLLQDSSDPSRRSILREPNHRLVAVGPQSQSSNKVDVEESRQWLEQEHARAAHALQQLLHDQQQCAIQIQQAEQQQQQQFEAEQKEQQKQKEQKEQQQRRAAAAAAAQEEAQQQQQVQLAQQEKAERLQKQQQQRADYVSRAHQLTSQLIALQASVQPFDQNPAAAPRRLRFKKIVNGRVNTLSEHVDKIVQVATEVVQAIAAARQEDEQAQQQAQPELARGKRYLVNLLASKVIVRAQAEGFNGCVVCVCRCRLFLLFDGSMIGAAPDSYDLLFVSFTLVRSSYLHTTHTHTHVDNAGMVFHSPTCWRVWHRKAKI